MKIIPLLFPILSVAVGPVPLMHAAAATNPAVPATPAAAVTQSAGELPVHLKFSDPTKAGTVRLKLTWGHVTVTANDAPDVTVSSNIKSKQHEPKAPGGLRRLDSEVSYSATEKDNVITLDFGGEMAGPTMSGATVALTVPRRTSVIVSSAFGGNVEITGVSGDVEVHDMNGKVTLNHISGAALVDTVNGKISATFAKVTADKAISFTTMNGKIDVWVPADTRANVRLRTQNGAIYTDFDDKALVTKTEPAAGQFPRVTVGPHSKDKSGTDWQDDVREATREGIKAARKAMQAAREAAEAARQGVVEATGKPLPPIPPLPPSFGSLSGGKVVVGKLNGGGPDIQIATMNGTITLRKLKS